jgi:hypothetical protein
MKSYKILITCYSTLLTIALCSCGTIGKVTTLNPKTGRFPANDNEVTILKKVSVNADTLKSLIIVPNTQYCLEMVKNMKYFNEVMTLAQLQDTIIAKGLTDKIPSVSDKIGIKRAYQYFKPFVIMSFNQDKKELNWYTRLELYDPNKNELIFQNEIWVDMMWSGTTDKATLYPLFNSFLDYLLEQK